MIAARLHTYDPTFSSPTPLAIESVRDPQIVADDDVLVKVVGAGLCRTDLHLIEGYWESRLHSPLPLIPGHENAGVVEQVGAGVDSFRPGDEVIVHPYRTDGLCPACRRGDDMMCVRGSFPGLSCDGGFAEYLVAPERALVSLPAGVTVTSVAPYADAGLTAYHAVRRAIEQTRSGVVMVIGAGGLGHIGVQTLRALSSCSIIAVDPSPIARQLASECGAHWAVTPEEAPSVLAESTGSRGADVVIDFVGEDSSIPLGLRSTAAGGQYLLVGYGGEVRIPAVDLTSTERRIVGCRVGTHAELSELMELVRLGAVSLKTTHVPLSEINVAIHDLHHGLVAGRVVITPGP